MNADSSTVSTSPQSDPFPDRTRSARRCSQQWLAAGVGNLPCEEGEHPAAIARRLGHSSVATVLDRYGHLLPGLDAGAATALDRLRAAAAPQTDRADIVGLSG